MAVNVGVAAHISGAAGGAGSIRFNPVLTPAQRASIQNGIWLCQTCSSLIDKDPLRYTEQVLHGWKRDTECEAHLEIGKAKRSKQSSAPERALKRDLKLRDQMRKDFLKPWEQIARQRSAHPERTPRPYEKFCHGEIIIHRLGDDTYPDLDDRPGISPWFRVEMFDFYHRGIKVILGIESGVVKNSPSYAGNLHWAITPFNPCYDPTRFRRISIWRLGLIPFRNIRHYDLQGDEYYNCPHLYCTFGIDGMPYESFEHAVVAKEGELYDWPLNPALQLPAEAVMGCDT